MDLRKLFNIVLLSLSLATLLITLVSYLLYKLRQLSAQKQVAGLVKLESTFYKRFAPHFEQMNESWIRSKTPKTKTRLQFMQSLGVLLGILTLIISSTLLIDVYFSDRRVAHKRAASAEHYRDLAARGILKKFDLNMKEEAPRDEEKVSATVEIRNVALREKLSDRLTAMIDLSDRVELFADNDHGLYRDSLDEWRQFFKRNHISYTRFKNLEIAENTASVFIIPQAGLLKKTDIPLLKRLVSEGKGLIATGVVPTELSAFFGVEFIKNSDPKKLYPTLFSGDNQGLLGVPAGWISDWFPRVQSYTAFASEGSVPLAYESNYEARAKRVSYAGVERQSVRAVASGDFNERKVWLAVDPVEKKSTLSSTGVSSSISKADQSYRDSVLLSLMAWSVREPLAQVAAHKNGAETALVLSMDLHGNIEATGRYLKLAKKAGVPMTLFVNEEDVKIVSELFDEADPLDFGVGLSELKDIEARSLRDLFERVETTRLDLEEFYERRVSGTRYRESRVTPAMLGAFEQNRLQYVFAPLSQYRFAPYWSTRDGFAVIPDSALNDVRLNQDHSMGSDAQMGEALVGEYERIRKLGGAYFFNVNSENLDRLGFERTMHSTIKELAKRAPWKVNMGEYMEWWKNKESIRAEFAKTASGEFRLSVKNTGDSPASDIGFWMDTAQAGKLELLRENISNTPHLLVKNKMNQQNRMLAETSGNVVLQYVSAKQRWLLTVSLLGSDIEREYVFKFTPEVKPEKNNVVR